MKTIFALGLTLALLSSPAQAEPSRGGLISRSAGHGRSYENYGRSHRSISYSLGYYGPAYSLSYGYYPVSYGYYYRPYVYRPAPVYVYDGGYYDTADKRTNYVGNGLTLGAIAGAIIGNNSGSLGHSAWRGAAYGAAAGLLIGAIADNNASRREAAISVPSASVASAPSSVPSAVAQPRLITAPAAPASSMSDANRMFGRN
jgi:hypothetical protein